MTKPPSRLSKICSTALLGAALVVLPGCKASRNQWSFSMSRSFYGKGGGSTVSIGSSYRCHGNNDAAAAALVVLLVLPLVIDIVILPVTLAHDLCD